ncbi:MAG: adenylyl-sulfate kinase, partial [Desulfatiglandales bacterium]
VYMDEDIEYCKKNKPELYKLAEEGKISNMPGVDIEYEPPKSVMHSIKHTSLKKNITQLITMFQNH